MWLAAVRRRGGAPQDFEHDKTDDREKQIHTGNRKRRNRAAVTILEKDKQAAMGKPHMMMRHIPAIVRRTALEWSGQLRA
jgi:hypothetical protein